MVAELPLRDGLRSQARGVRTVDSQRALRRVQCPVEAVCGEICRRGKGIIEPPVRIERREPQRPSRAADRLLALTHERMQRPFERPSTRVAWIVHEREIVALPRCIKL